MNKKFNFLLNYKHTGRYLLEEDELDAALDLVPDEQPNDVADTTNVEEPTPVEDNSQQITASDNTTSNDEVVKINVTDIVKKQESIDSTVQSILDKIDNLIAQGNQNKQGIDQEINNLKQGQTNTLNVLNKELEKRVPTPTEKIQMQSLYSFPYNMKLSDYWKPAISGDARQYVPEVPPANPNDETNPVEQEYVLTQKDVDTGYSEYLIKKSF